MQEIVTPKIGLNIGNILANKKTKDNRKVEDKFQENGHFTIAYKRNCRLKSRIYQGQSVCMQ